jgi:hypothetical protein
LKYSKEIVWNWIRLNNELKKIRYRVHICIAWGEAEGCTVVLKGGTISMSTGRYIDNDFIPGLKTKMHS